MAAAIEPAAAAANGCPSCGRPRPPDVDGRVVRYCPGCGARLSATPTAELEAVPPGRRLGFGQALTFYFVAFLPLVVLLVAGGVDADELLWFDAFHLVLGLVGIVVYFPDVAAFLRGPRVTARGVLLTLAGVGLTLALAWLLLAAFSEDGGEPTVDALRAEGLGLGPVLVHIALIPAVTEEILFRLLILRGFERAFPARTAAIVTALVFAIVHLSPLSIVHLGLLGWVLAILRQRSGSLWPCVLTHAAYNGLVTLIWW